MQRIIDHYTDPADHLALDEAMLQAAEADQTGEAMRVWRFEHPTVVVGRSSKVDVEVNRSYCDQNGIPIYRRASGGTAVVGGPGCLMYSFVLNFATAQHLQHIDVAHQYVMTRVAQAVEPQVPDIRLKGICDLTWKNCKCSGNSLRMVRRHLLYHGTILHDFDLGLLSNCLAEAPRQPEYRDGRDHATFVTNISIDVDAFSSRLFETFGATTNVSTQRYTDRISQLRKQRYDDVGWHLKR